MCFKSIQTNCAVHPTRKIAPGIKWPRRVDHRSPPCSFEFKNAWNFSSTPPPHILTLHLSSLVPHSNTIRDRTAQFILSRSSAPPHSPFNELWVQGSVDPRSCSGMLVKKKIISPCQGAKSCTRLLTSAFCYT